MHAAASARVGLSRLGHCARRSLPSFDLRMLWWRSGRAPRAADLMVAVHARRPGLFGTFASRHGFYWRARQRPACSCIEIG
jgi:hypothetical protein